MKLLKKGIAITLFYVITGALLVYAASRSVDFINRTLPQNQQVIGLLALAATSGGSVAWLMLFLYSARGTGQKVIAAIMVGVDLVGEFALFTFDTLLYSGNSGMIAALPREDVQMVIIGLSALIAINIAATFAYHLTEPENVKNMREAAVRDELENKALAMIEKRGEELVANMAPKIADEWLKEFESKFTDYRTLGLGGTPAFSKSARRPNIALLENKAVTIGHDKLVTGRTEGELGATQNKFRNNNNNKDYYDD